MSGTDKLDAPAAGCGPDGCASRRTVLAAAGAGIAALLGCCATYGGSPPADPPPDGASSGDSGAVGGAPTDAAPTGTAPTGAATTEAGGGSGNGGGGTGGGGGGFAKTADIPVGGGKIFEAEEIVVTQPKAGTYKAFSAICTHAGCVVNTVEGGTINCNCHKSKFAVADGSVVRGPAPRPLPAKAIKVSGGNISLA